jgi:photosystem II stability/assembly factor-like uncharacterized protein
MCVAVAGWPAASHGATWEVTQLAAPQTTLSASAFPGGAAYVLDPSAPAADPTIGGQTLWASEDFGATWTQRPAQPFRFTARLSFATPALGFAIHNGEVLRTADGGRSWTPAAPLPAPQGASVSLHAIDAPAQGALVAAAGDSAYLPACGTESVYTSRDHGNSWRVTPLPGGEQLGTKEIRFLDDRHGLVLASHYASPCGENDTSVVLLTDDGGEHFRQVFDCQGFCTSIALASPSVLLVGYNDGRIARSTDAGATFNVTRLVPEDAHDVYPELFWVDGLDFADAHVGYASTMGRGLWRTTDGGATWTLEDSLKSTVYAPGIPALAVADAQHAIYAGAPGIFHRTP